MSATKKYYLSMTVIALSIAAALMGLKNIAIAWGADGLQGAGLLFGGVIVGIIATIFFRYYRQRRTETKDQQQIAVETLANIAKSSKQFKQ